MDMLLSALANVFTPAAIIAMLGGSAVGMLIGSMPGLSASMGVALFLPFTFGMEASAGILLLISIYCSAIYSGSISAILINTPGTSAATATLLDGFALTKKGQARKALDMSLQASVIGGLLSGVVLLAFAPQIARWALTFGPAEYFALGLMGLTIIAGVSSEGVVKGLALGAFGFFISTIGVDPVSGISRYTFGVRDLVSGVDQIPAMIGLFALAEMFNQIESGATRLTGDVKIDKDRLSWRQMLPFSKVLLKSSVIGMIVGAIPGTGSGTAAFLAYKTAKGSSKHPEEYGKGSLEALSATESANNAVTGAALIPMLTLGIPGDAVTAILMGGLTIQGLAPGPQLFEKNGVLVYTIMIGFLVANIIMYFEGKAAILGFSKICNIPNYILIPVVVCCCLVGAFAVHNSLYAVKVALVFGIIAYLISKFGYKNLVAVLIAIILGPIVEQNFRRALVLSGGSASIFFTRPICLVIILISVGSIVMPLIKARKSKASAAAGIEE